MKRQVERVNTDPPKSATSLTSWASLESPLSDTPDSGMSFDSDISSEIEMKEFELDLPPLEKEVTDRSHHDESLCPIPLEFNKHQLEDFVLKGYEVPPIRQSVWDPKLDSPMLLSDELETVRGRSESVPEDPSRLSSESIGQTGPDYASALAWYQGTRENFPCLEKLDKKYEE